jgi:hypothetical protein
MAAQRPKGGRVEDAQSSSSNATAGPSSKGRTKRRTAGSASLDDGLGAELDRFVADHPGGWNHDDWLGLLGSLRERGYETSDQDTLGLALEGRRRS